MVTADFFGICNVKTKAANEVECRSRLQPSLVLLPMQDKTEEFFLQHLHTASAGPYSPPPGLSYTWASMARHLSHYYFHFWPLVQTLRAWPDCYISVEFLHAPIPWKGSDSSITTTK